MNGRRLMQSVDGESVEPGAFRRANECLAIRKSSDDGLSHGISTVPGRLCHTIGMIGRTSVDSVFIENSPLDPPRLALDHDIGISPFTGAMSRLKEGRYVRIRPYSDATGVKTLDGLGTIEFALDRNGSGRAVLTRSRQVKEQVQEMGKCVVDWGIQYPRITNL